MLSNIEMILVAVFAVAIVAGAVVLSRLGDRSDETIRQLQEERESLPPALARPPRTSRRARRRR